MYVPPVLKKQTAALCGRRDDVVWVRLNRLETSNAVDDRMAGELRGIWSWLRDEPQVSTVVITGNGPEAFSVGLSARSRPEDPSFAPREHGVGQRIVAAVNGIVVGEAFALLDDADLVVAASHVSFISPVPLGEAGRSRWLDAADWSTPMRADQARDAGLVDLVCPLVELKRTVWGMVSTARQVS